MTQSAAPAERIIQKFGGITKCARALKRPKSTVQRWKDSGFIHPNYFPEILDAAVETQIALDPLDFNLVDTRHPAFNAKSTASPDDTSGHVAGSSRDPIPETSESPAPVRGVGDRVVEPADIGR